MLKICQLVMLVGSDGFMPPFGAIGEIVAWDGEDYDVLFPKHPCPVPPDITWCAMPHWLMPIDGDLLSDEDELQKHLTA